MTRAIVLKKYILGMTCEKATGTIYEAHSGAAKPPAVASMPRGAPQALARPVRHVKVR